MYALVPQNAELSLSFLQMHQGYHKDADRLNSQLDLYAENPRYQNLFIDLVRNDTGKKIYSIFPMQQYQKLGRGELVPGLHLSHIQATQLSKVQASQNKNALESFQSLLLGPQIRNVEAINSRRNWISPRKGFHFLLHRGSSILQDICFLYRIRRFIRVYKYTQINSREITSLPESKNVMNMTRHFNHPPK